MVLAGDDGFQGSEHGPAVDRGDIGRSLQPHVHVPPTHGIFNTSQQEMGILSKANAAERSFANTASLVAERRPTQKENSGARVLFSSLHFDISDNMPRDSEYPTLKINLDFVLGATVQSALKP